jgi:hypothetical protein
MTKNRKTPAVKYPKGHFTELMRLANWPPGFRQRMLGEVEMWRAVNSAANRQRHGLKVKVDSNA